MTGNTIVGQATTSGAFSVLGTEPGNTIANNTFEAFGAAGTAAAQAAVAAAQSAAKAVSQAAPALKTLVAPVSAPAPSTASTGAAAPATATAPQTSSPSPPSQAVATTAVSQSSASTPQETIQPDGSLNGVAPVQAANIPVPANLPAGYTTGDPNAAPITAQDQALAAAGEGYKSQADAILSGVLAIMPQ